MRSTGIPTPTGLSTPAGIALYVGALLGPSLLLLPGLAARIAGPASLVAWALLLVLSGLLARVFMVLGRTLPGTDGVVGYTRAGFGPGRVGDAAARAVGWCFLAGVVLGAPVVCLIGAAYVADLTGGGPTATVLLATVLLAVVVAMALAGRAVRGGVQLVLVALLAVLVAVAVLGAAPHAQVENWTPFAPHGWWSVGRAASVLMLSFVGWEAISQLVARLRDPGRQLPRIIGAAFAVTALIYLGLAVVTVGVLGARAGTGVPLADLLDVALGGTGRYLAAAAAVALTLAATNAYLSGAVELAGRLRGAAAARRPHGVQLAVAGIGLLVLGLVGAGVITLDALVAVPTALFVTVYALCTAAAVRLTTGGTRVLAALACAVVLVILVFSGWALLAVAAVAVPAAVARRRSDRGRGGLERDDPRHGGRGRDGRLLAWIHQEGVELGEVVDPVQDPPVREQAAGTDRPEEGHAELQRRLEPVRPERREQRRADGVVEHGSEERAEHVPGRVGERLRRGERQLDRPGLDVRGQELETERGRRGGHGRPALDPSQNTPDRPITSASSISWTTATVGRRGRAVVDEFHPQAVRRFRVTFADVTASAAMSAGPVVPDGDR